MLKIIGGVIVFFAILIFSFVLLGLSVIARSFGGFRNFFRMRRAAKEQFKKQNQYTQDKSSRTTTYVAPEDKIGRSYADKILDKNESEYVDFEDIPNKE